jgi:hypothetical protein
MGFAIPHSAPRRSSVPRYLVLQARAAVALGVLAGSALLLAVLSGPLAASAGIDAAALCIIGGIMTVAPLYVATAIGRLSEARDDLA